MNKYVFRRAVAGVITTAIVLGGSVAVIAHSFSDVETFEEKTVAELTCPDLSALSITNYSTNEIDPICPFCGQRIEGKYAFLTWSEIKLLASLVDMEVGIENYDCKKAVASVVLNRMLLTDDTLENVIFAENQFSAADKVREHTPSEESVNAVKEVLGGGVTIPEYVTFFRADNYHKWGDQIPYIQIGNTYFSYSESIKKQLGY
ncbi:MAG: cell wall hydrolase [Bacteroides sp.]|nr:cell wall hydrolase [Bacteroides sp.]MCM1362785.1 cell wall hydrolase [Clostridiales bacterium]